MNEFEKISKDQSHQSETDPPIETPKEVMERYLSMLDLKKEDLINKNILDVGSGVKANFAVGMRESGISENVVSVSKNAPKGDKDKSLVVVNAQDMEFPDNTFDYVISVNALPHVAATGMINVGTPTGEIREGIPVYKVTDEDFIEARRQESELISKAVSQCLRVVKEGAEIRFAWGTNNPEPLKPRVLEALKAALVGVGEVIQSPPNGREGLWVIRKLSVKK